MLLRFVDPFVLCAALVAEVVPFLISGSAVHRVVNPKRRPARAGWADLLAVTFSGGRPFDLFVQIPKKLKFSKHQFIELSIFPGPCARGADQGKSDQPLIPFRNKRPKNAHVNSPVVGLGQGRLGGVSPLPVRINAHDSTAKDSSPQVKMKAVARLSALGGSLPHLFHAVSTPNSHSGGYRWV